MLMCFLHFSLGDQLLNLLKQNCTERERCIFAEHAKSVKKDSNLEDDDDCSGQIESLDENPT